VYRAPRGTADILPAEQKYWHYIEARATQLAHLHGYNRLDTPVFEASSLFDRTVGENTDIVQKEMYTFEDRGGDPMTLRPEGTAPVCRAYLEHGMYTLPQPIRLYYFCPVFRYERPQLGRYREHHQFGLEAIGDSDASVDAEVVSLAWRLMGELGLKNLSLMTNSIGDGNCRPRYLKELKDYYGRHLGNLCKECQGRYDRNPLRLLDCKQENCRTMSVAAPRSVDHLCQECRDHWEQFQLYVGVHGIPLTIDHRLVRGLDYYTRTVFEIQPEGGGAQSTICGGGRYDRLIEQLGGRSIPGVGFATGMERLVLNLKKQEISIPESYPSPVVIAHTGTESRLEALRLARRLQSAQISAVLAPASKSLKGQMRHASSLGARYVLILGDEEVRQQVVVIRDMGKGTQESVSLSKAVERMSKSDA
jgi:histidyl-tRNA synthetase